MRIISGTAKGTKLYTLEGLETRPTLDRVKESLFNIIYDKAIDSTVLDLFSGSGAIGLEFASRGAKKVYLCDKSKDAIKIIEKNIKKTHLEEKIEYYQLPFEILLNNQIKDLIDIVYIDPPYKTDYAYESLKILIDNKMLKKDSYIIIETDDEKRIIEQIKSLKVNIVDQRKYGRAYLIFLREQ